MFIISLDKTTLEKLCCMKEYILPKGNNINFMKIGGSKNGNQTGQMACMVGCSGVGSCSDGNDSLREHRQRLTGQRGERKNPDCHHHCPNSGTPVRDRRG
ncbi:hypothetical protein D3C75_1103240 [compost metagenome]